MASIHSVPNWRKVEEMIGLPDYSVLFCLSPWPDGGWMVGIALLCDAKLIVIREHNPRYRYGEFITSESVWSIPPVDSYQGHKIYQYEYGFWCELPECYTGDGPEPRYWTCSTKEECIAKIDELLAVINAEAAI